MLGPGAPPVLLLVLASPALAVPIVKVIDVKTITNPIIGAEFCVLPPELDYGGNVTFLEDCKALDRYKLVPLPAPTAQKLGIHAMVCCPRFIPESAICFPSDAWCPSYVPPTPVDYSANYEDDPEYEAVDYTDYQTVEQPKMSDRTCDPSLEPQVPYIPGLVTSATCVGINRCPGIVNNPQAPATHVVPCGFTDDSDNVLMVCCPTEMVKEVAPTVQEPRFPGRNGRARDCEDRSKLCRRWRGNNGCRLDLDIVISEYDKYNGRVASKSMFDFMQSACSKTCGWCGAKGCVDEHPLCPSWARKGMCVVNPFFMAHTCRESCGVCGFLSPFNVELQVVGENSYTDFSKPDFDCGRYLPLCQINGTPCNNTAAEPAPVTTTPAPAPVVEVDADDFDLRSVDGGVFFSSDPNPDNPTEYFCGATMVSDRWAVAASHCYDDFATGVSAGPRKVRINTIRDGTPYNEIIEIKRIYKHPGYTYPNLYNDVAVLELGRRVEYQYDKFGDTPTCIDKGLFPKEDKVATVQGFGLTETGTKGVLLETNVTVISNQRCVEVLRSNTSDNLNAQKKILKALPVGLQYGLICAQGIYNEEKGIYSGSCKGDSGGPLTQVDSGRTTLIGIVSGGIDCGKGFPGWYTRVEHFKTWIQCVIDQSARFSFQQEDHMVKVEEACRQRIQEAPSQCEKLVEDPSVALFDLRGTGLTPEDACEDYNTGVIVRLQGRQPGQGDGSTSEIFGDSYDEVFEESNDEIFGESNDEIYEDPADEIFS